MPTKSHFQVTMTHREALPANRTCSPCLHSLFRWVLEDGPVFSHFWISWNLAIIALQNWCFRRAPRRPWTTLMLPRASHPSTVTCTHLGDERNKVTPSLCLEVTRSHARNVECKVRCLSIFCSATRIETDLQHGPGEYLFMIAIQAARYCSPKSLLGRTSPQLEQMVGDPFNTHRLNFNDRSLINCFASSVLCLNGSSVGLDLRKCCSGKKDLCVFMCVVCTVEFHLWSVHCACCRAISVCQVLACHKLWNWWDSICPQRIGRCLRWEMGWPGSLKVSKLREVWVYGEWNQMCFGSAVIMHDFTSLDIDFTCQSVNDHISKENDFWSRGHSLRCWVPLNWTYLCRLPPVEIALWQRPLESAICWESKDSNKTSRRRHRMSKLKGNLKIYSAYKDLRWYKRLVFGRLDGYFWSTCGIYSNQQMNDIEGCTYLGSALWQAKQYLKLAANRQHAGALALLGYIYCLGGAQGGHWQTFECWVWSFDEICRFAWTMERWSLHSKIGISQSLEIPRNPQEKRFVLNNETT